MSTTPMKAPVGAERACERATTMNKSGRQAVVWVLKEGIRVVPKQEALL